MVMRGSSAIKRAKAEGDRAKAAMDALRVNDLYLKGDGDEVEMYFLGTPETEPVVLYYHSVQKKFQGAAKVRWLFELCARSYDKSAKCVFCWANKNGMKNVGRAQKNAVFSVADARWVHKIPNAEKTQKAGGREKFDWYDCPDDDSCKLCKKGKKRVRNGLKKLRLNMTAAQSLDGTNDHLQRKCLSCGGSKTVKLTGFKKGKKVLPDLEGVEDTEGWEAQFTCSKCEDPNPCSIFRAPITMRRNGTGTTTSYTFIAGEPFETKPKWVAKIEPMDLTTLSPRDADNAAELLDIDNPFSEGGGKKRKKGGASDYDSDDEEEEDEPFGDDDDEEEDEESEDEEEEDEDE